jgi:hypothetical protein
MQILTLKTRLSVLWIFMAVAMSAHSVLTFMDKGMVEQVWKMEMGPGMMLFMAIFYWVPLVMAVLSVTLKDSANRWANMILGIVFTVLNIFHLVEHLTTGPSAHQILIIGSTVVVTALIFWSALKWPKQEV